jgi:predicted transcriptional regulator
MKAKLMLDERHIIADDAFVELVVWQLSSPLPGSRHTYKYRLAFVVRGACVLRYDNEPGKGDISTSVRMKPRTASVRRAFCWKIFGVMLKDGGVEMATVVTLEVSSREKSNKRFLQAFEGKVQGVFLTFETPALLFKVISGKRWELLNVMTGSGPMSIREAARRLSRDVKAVHGDVAALLNAGILQKTEKDQIVFPFDAIHVDFMLLKEAA